MQHIGLSLEDELGNTLERSDINFTEIIATLWQLNKLDSYPWLNGIDPYGNTIININLKVKLKYLGVSSHYVFS